MIGKVSPVANEVEGDGWQSRHHTALSVEEIHFRSLHILEEVSVVLPLGQDMLGSQPSAGEGLVRHDARKKGGDLPR